MAEKILEMKNITKVFPGVKALDQVDFNVYQGQVGALLGENGAGKSTLVKVMTGVHEKTSGEMYLKGEKVDFTNTAESQARGISIIHQELNLIPEMTIGENIFLGREPKNKFGKIQWKTINSEAKALLSQLNIDEDPTMKVKKLSVGKQQMVEIAKALSLNAEIIVMDEPTDALTDKEIESLFEVINTLRDQGKSIVYISHKLDEIFEICDNVTILRDGQFIVEKPIEALNKDDMIEYMVGRKLEEQFPSIDFEIGEEVLKVEHLTNAYVNDINFELYEGEILGIAGLMGAGRTELAKSIYGSIKNDSGKIYVDGLEVNINYPWDGIDNKIVYVSEDRKTDGLILGLSVLDNIHISSYHHLTQFLGKIDKSRAKTLAQQYVEDMSIKTPSLGQKVKNLSGGNQQKVSIAKCLMTDPKILILDEPTRGVDVGAKKEIYELMNQYKEKGMSIIMVSSEIPELLGMCDRILVMHEGEIYGELSVEEATQQKIMKYAVGQRGE